LPAVKLHMTQPGDQTEKPPVFPLGGDDRERVDQAISNLLKQQV